MYTAMERQKQQKHMREIHEGKELTLRKSVAIQIKRQLINKGVSQTEAANKAGITEALMSKILNGRTGYTLCTLTKVVTGNDLVLVLNGSGGLVN